MKPLPRLALLLLIVALAWVPAPAQERPREAEPPPAPGQQTPREGQAAPQAQPDSDAAPGAPRVGEAAREAPRVGADPLPTEPSPALAEASQQAADATVFGYPVPGWLIELFRWTNFLVFFGLLYYLLRGPAAEFFAGRGRAILQGLEQGKRASEDARRRLAEVESRLSRIEEDIAGMKASASAEAAADQKRLRAAARAEAAKILANAEQEIGALTKAGRAELKGFAAELAVELAEQHIRARLTPEQEAALLREYAGHLSNRRS